MGWTPWWVPPAKPSGEISEFLSQLVALLDGSAKGAGETTLSVLERGRFRLHYQRERDPRAAKIAKQHHGLRCQACKFDFHEHYGPLGEGFIEAHHLRPLASLKVGEVRRYEPADFAVLCANCHRMIHRTDDPSDLAAFRAHLAKQRTDADSA